MDELTAQFARMQGYLAALHDLVAAAEEHAPRRSRGSDRSGAVSAVLGPDGLPESFQVRSDWDRRIKPAALGNAVLEAIQVATGNRLDAWTAALRDEGWADRIEQFKSGNGTAVRRSGPADDPPASGADLPEVRPRRLDELAEDVMASIDRVDQSVQQPAEPVHATGAAAGGRLTLALSATGLASCVVDPGWAATQTATGLTRALNDAMAAARKDFASKPVEPGPGASLNGLLAETMAMLRDPRRLAD